jgi:ankyrin repeat protein
VDNMHSLHEYARNGDLKGVKELLQDNPDQVNSKDIIGETPLHYAAGNGHNAVAELLLANNADVNAKDNGGNTPLQRAASKGHKVVVKLLPTTSSSLCLSLSGYQK